MKNLQLWEMLVPTVINGKPIRVRYHRVFDKFVRGLSGGLTILKPTKGQWVCPNSNELVEERMIPVRIACCEEDIHKIMDYAAKYYSQDAIFAARVSDYVIIKENPCRKVKKEV